MSNRYRSRYLKKNIVFPLMDKERLEKRYDIIDNMRKKFLETEELRQLLEDVYDLERIVGKISYESVNPKDLLQLKKSLGILPGLQELLKKIKIDDHFNLEKDANDYINLYRLLDSAISPNAPFSAKDGGVIKSGYHID